MVDLHCHLLPGVDDGAKSVNESLALARYYVADGVTHVFATPHCHSWLRLFRDEIVPRVAQLNEALAREGVGLTVLPGAENQCFDVETYQADYEAERLCHLGDRPTFTLMEFPWQEHAFPEGAVEHVCWLRERGTTPILAHPERYGYFKQDPDRLCALVEAGAWLQVSVASLLGGHGDWAREWGEEILAAYPDAILSTDTHNLKRFSSLREGFATIRERFGPAREADMRDRAARILAASVAAAEPG